MRAGAAFRHEAFLYAGVDEFVDGTSAFLREGLDNGEAALVVVAADKIDRLRRALGPTGNSDRVEFADMAEVGMNPARIIPAWSDFVSEQVAAGRRFRGIGEPIWPERTDDELVECHRHEALLNLAFAEAPPWWLLCPYDTTSLKPAVVDEARRTHPFVADGPSLGSNGSTGASEAYMGLAKVNGPFAAPLPAPPAHADERPFTPGPLAAVRGFVATRARAAGFDAEQVADLELAVTEMATNSMRHGGGGGVVRVWVDEHELVCEVADAGRLDGPLVGRIRPDVRGESGRGLWLVNQVCDLVQVRTFDDATVVRAHLYRK